MDDKELEDCLDQMVKVGRGYGFKVTKSKKEGNCYCDYIVIFTKGCFTCKFNNYNEMSKFLRGYTLAQEENS